MQAIETNEHEYKGHTIEVKWFYDEHSDAPWENSDGHGIISNWATRDKAPGERILCGAGRSRRYYDVKATMAIALRDGWDTKPYKTGTKREQAARAVDADFEFLRRWCNNDWFYVGYVATIDGEEFDSCWGFESDYASDCERDEILPAAQAHIDEEEMSAFEEMANA